ncbi:cysteine-rich venom protein 6-like [Leptopilina boulardi]|uniref:cysteine-rich venom protein 6-like n=1 Tax=Leptopilina boulardi TaxID=63433 RepID=UPI0021F552D2|nr:cysteine-rich venom protein 6-like [Leptopilina boulardi]
MIVELYFCFLLTKIMGNTEILTEHGKCLDPHEIYSEYGQHPICDVTCDIYHGKAEPNICPLVFVQRCICSQGYLRNILDGNCIRPDECPDV